MNIALFRFEKHTINFVVCNINAGSLSIGEREKISLESVQKKGGKYRKVLDEISQIQTKINPALFACQTPQKYMGKLNEEGYSYLALLNLFCYDNGQNILELTPSIVREKLGIKQKELKIKIEETKSILVNNYGIPKTNILLEGLTYLYLLKEII